MSFSENQEKVKKIAVKLSMLSYLLKDPVYLNSNIELFEGIQDLLKEIESDFVSTFFDDECNLINFCSN